MPTIDACNFIEEPPEFDYRSGLFHVTQRIGNKHYERVMRPEVYMVALRRAAEVARAHFKSSAVLSIVPRDDHQAAAAAGRPSK